MSEVVIRFTQGAAQLRPLMWNLLGRRTVGDDLAIEVDGERQAWWDEEMERSRESLRRAEEYERERQQRLALIRAAIAADPSRNDDEIGVEAGVHPSVVKYQRPRPPGGEAANLRPHSSGDADVSRAATRVSGSGGPPGFAPGAGRASSPP